MKNLILLVFLAVLAMGAAGCRTKHKHNNTSTNGNNNNPPTVPTNPQDPPGQADPTKENSISIQGVAVPNSTSITLGVNLIGDTNNPGDPKALGTLPPAGYRFKATFTFNVTGGRREVVMEVDTLGNQKLTAGPGDYEALDPAGLTFKLEVVEGLPNTGQPDQVVETPIPTTSMTVTTENKVTVLGFNLTRPPLTP